MSAEASAGLTDACSERATINTPCVCNALTANDPICYAAATSVISTNCFEVTLCYRGYTAPQTSGSSDHSQGLKAVRVGQRLPLDIAYADTPASLQMQYVDMCA